MPFCSLFLIYAPFELGRNCWVLKCILCFSDFMIIPKDKGKQDYSWCDPFNWEWSKFIELCFGWCGTWAILASSWSFLSLLSFCCMKSLSSVLWPCMLYSLLVRSIPLWSSFTSNKTFSRETKEYTDRTNLVEIFSVKLWCLSKYGLPYLLQI